MAPSLSLPEPSGALERPTLLNEKFKVHSYDGGSFKSRAQYDIKNALVPIIEPFHCSGSGTKFNLVLKCSEDFTLTHFYVSGPGPRCTEPIKSGLVWVTEQPPDVECMKKFDNMSSEEVMEIMKGVRSYSTSEEASVLPDPCVYFSTDPTSRESEVELSKWREGKFVAIKFLDTHKDQVNIDVGIVGLIGYFGRHAKQQVPFGPWMRRSVRQIWVHPKPLKSMFSSSGWVCDGRDFTGGCRSGQTDFHQTNVYTVTFRCTTSAIDLCEKCAYDPTLGKVTEASIEADLEALGDPAMCKLAVTRLRNQWRRNWPATLPKYFSGGLLDALVQALQRSTESTGRPDEERAVQTRQQSGAETQKRQARRALLHFTMELTQRLLGIGPGGDVNANDLVWALCPEPEEHWDEGRVLHLPRAEARAVEPPAQAAAAASPAAGADRGALAPLEGQAAASSGGREAAAAGSFPGTPAGTPGGAAASGGAAGAAGFLVSWRDGQAPSRVHPRNVWKMTADEDIMVATTGLYLEVTKGENCDPSKVSAFLQQGADLMATNGEGTAALLAAVRSGAPAEVIGILLENGAYPDAAGREGVTPLQHVMQLQATAAEAGLSEDAVARLQQTAELLRKHGAAVPEDRSPAQRLAQLRETFGLKMVGALLTLQSPLGLPIEILEVLHLLFRELPLSVVKQALEPQAFRALTALFQYFVGGTDNLSTAVVGCRIMRAIYSQPDASLRYLVLSHGAVRWSQRLACTKDVAQCGLYRQPHHEKVTPEELSREARALSSDLTRTPLPPPAEVALISAALEQASSSGQEWRVNARLVEVVAALEVARAAESPDSVAAAKEALLAFRELLKRTEKGNLTDERCTAFELEQSDLPGELLRFLKHRAEPAGPQDPLRDPIRQPAMNLERWSVFRDAFSESTKQTRKGLVRLMKALHAVLETGEAFPVWRHRKERGLRALTEPIHLKLRPVTKGGDGAECSMPLLPQALRSQVSIMLEPLVPVKELARYLLRVTPSADEQYLACCRRLVGATIRDRNSGERFVVLAFELLNATLPLPIHTLRRESTGEVQRVLLAMCDYALSGLPPPPESTIDFQVSLDKLRVVGGSEAYASLLRELQRQMGVEPTPGEGDLPATPELLSSPGAQQALQQALCAATSCPTGMDEALALLVLERSRLASSAASALELGEGAGASESGVDPSMRAHTVMIAVSDEIPFDLFWPMVRDDIMGAVRELFPRGVPQMEEAVQAGVTQNGMGPIAQRLTLEEAETLAARVGHVVQTAVTVDQQVVQELQRERARSTQAETIPVASRVQFSPKSGENWVPGVVVGHGPPLAAGAKRAGPEKFDVVDDHGVLWEQLPRGRVRVPAARRESPSGMGTPIQAVLSQADLVRIREHLRRRQEEWAERHAQGAEGAAGASSAGGGGGGGGSRAGVRALEQVLGGVAGGGSGPSGGGGAASGAELRASASRPTSAPDALGGGGHRSRAAGPEGAARRISGSDLLSRDGSLGDVDPTAALEMVHFINEEGLGDEEFDDDGEGLRDPGEDGEEDDEDLPLLEPSEAGDSQGDAIPAAQLGLGSGRGGGREGDGRGGEGDAAAAMEEELRVLEQLRAMEQIISEVLDPHGGGRARRGEAGGAEDFLAGPLANFRIRMGGGPEGRVETYQIRRASSRGSDRAAGSGAPQMEALRGELPAFVRAADSANPTASLDHPVAERLGAADLLQLEEDDDEPMEPGPDDDRSALPRVFFRFCLQPPAETKPAAAGTVAAVPSSPAAAGAPAAPPEPAPAPAPAVPVQFLRPAAPLVSLPPSWNLLKAMQFLQDQQHPRASALGPEAPCIVQAMQKVALDGWCLGYTLTVADTAPFLQSQEGGSPTAGAGDMDVDASASQGTPRRKAGGADSFLPLGGAASVTARPGGLPAKKRRRMQPASRTSSQGSDEVAREMYSRFASEARRPGPHELIARCGDNVAVADAVELMHLLRAQGPNLGVEASLWVSSKLDRKLRYQLEDPLSVVSGTLPLWATTLPRLCPFLFSLKTRKMLLKYTAFGPSFAVHWTQESKVGSFLRRRATVQTELNAQADPRKIQELSQELSNIEEHVVKSNFWLGTLQSTLVRMQKGDDLLRQADVVMEIVSSASNLVEVQFDGETGFGNAVTQSFYVEVAQALQDRAVNRRVPMWVEDDDTSNSQFLHCRRGLLIKPLLDGPQRDEVVRRFRFLGRLMGQALREGFIAPLPLTEEFFALVLGEPLGAAGLPRPGGGSAGELVGALADFAAELAAGEAALVAAATAAGRVCTAEELRAWRHEQAARPDFAERFLGTHDAGTAEGSPHEPTSFDRYISLVEPCFLETGLSGAPLCPGGEAIVIDVDNVQEFVKQAARFWFETGVAAQVDAYRAGLNDVFPFECLVTFSRSELREMFCGEDRIEWDEQALLTHLHPGGGLTEKSPTYKFLVAELLEMNQAERSRFLDFVSSCPRLPPGGIAKFHIDVFPDSTATKQGFPRSRACANQLYLPPYTSKEELHAKLHEAMHCSAGHHEQRMREL